MIHIFRGWHLAKNFCDYIFKLHLCSFTCVHLCCYGMYPNKEKFENENFTDNKITTKSVKFMFFENYCVYGILLSTLLQLFYTQEPITEK